MQLITLQSNWLKHSFYFRSVSSSSSSSSSSTSFSQLADPAPAPSLTTSKSCSSASRSFSHCSSGGGECVCVCDWVFFKVKFGFVKRYTVWNCSHFFGLLLFFVCEGELKEIFFVDENSHTNPNNENRQICWNVAKPTKAACCIYVCVKRKHVIVCVSGANNFDFSYCGYKALSCNEALFLSSIIVLFSLSISIVYIRLLFGKWFQTETKKKCRTVVAACNSNIFNWIL